MPDAAVCIQPGLFKGTYGDHGLEIVLLTYDEDRTKAIITKVTVCDCFNIEIAEGLKFSTIGC